MLYLVNNTKLMFFSNEVFKWGPDTFVYQRILAQY